MSKSKKTQTRKRKPAAADHSDGPPLTPGEQWQWAASAAASVLYQCRELMAVALTVSERAAILAVVVAAHALYAEATERMAGK